MNRFLTRCDDVVDGLVSMTIPQNECMADALQTSTAQRLISQGATVYIMADGKTSMLSIKKPEGSFAKAVSLRDLCPREAA